MKQRTVSRVIVVALVVVVGIFTVVYNHIAGGSKSVVLQGADLGEASAPGFTLTDQHGQVVSLASLRGHPVALAFLTTRGAGDDTLMADRMRETADALGAQAADVRWVAISADPASDTATTASAFVAAHHLDGRLLYLLGGQAQLAPIWDAFHISVQAMPSSSGQAVVHTVGVFVIDQQGRERVFLEDVPAASVLATDMRHLLAG